MYRNSQYSNQDWENRNESQRGNRPQQQNYPYGNHPDQGSSRNQGYRQHREENFGGGYGQRQPNRRDQDYNSGYGHQERNQYDDFRGAYRLDNQRNESGYQQLNDRNFGPDYGYGHAGNSRTGGDYGRNQSDYGTGGTYGASRNAGSMGSYGGAQGYGSSSNGYSSEKWGSGHHGAAHQPHHTVYGAYRDKNSFAPGERESYDGSQRSGSQGADSTRGWTTPGRSGQSGHYQHRTSEADSRYELYDSALSQYNRGDYNHNTGTSITDDLNLRTHQEYAPRQVYGSRSRGTNRQGDGNDMDRNLGSDMEYQNTAGSLSVGYDGFRGQAPQTRYYDPLSGDVRNPGAERNR